MNKEPWYIENIRIYGNTVLPKHPKLTAKLIKEQYGLEVKIRKVKDYYPLTIVNSYILKSKIKKDENAYYLIAEIPSKTLKVNELFDKGKII